MGILLEMPVIGTGADADPFRPKYGDALGSWAAVDCGATMLVWTTAVGPALAGVVSQPDVTVHPPANRAAARARAVAHQPALTARPVRMGVGADLVEF